MDLTALAGPTTGIGQMVRQLARRLPTHDGLDLTGLFVSWRGRNRLTQVAPDGWRLQPLLLPARAAHRAWLRFDRPRVRGFDLVHGPNYVVPPTGGAVRLVTVHDLTAWRYPELVDHHARSFPRHVARAVDGGAHVHAVSEHVGQELEHELGVDPDRIHVVTNGLEPVPEGDGDRGRARIGAPYVLAVGTIEPRKDHASLVRAMAAIWPVLPDLRLVIAGARGWGRAAFDDVVADLGVADKIDVLGYVDEATKADLLYGAEVLAYPSRYEGFGIPILEAMAAGIPVVTTTAGAIPEVAGRAAILVEPEDPSALAGALLSVLEDDELRRHLATAGRERAMAFSWSDSVDRLAALYRQLVDGRVPAVEPVT